MKMNFKRLFLILWGLSLLSCVTTAQRPWIESPLRRTPETTTGAWWNERIFYEIYVRSFQDTNGDGFGDLRGVISRLDYLSELGVGGIWLMPVFEAKSQHGYDTLDYRSIEKDYGTKEDFQDLVKEAHKRDIKVIVDLVLNHSSHQHPWFQEAVKNPKGPYGEYYLFSDKKSSQFWRLLSDATPLRYFYGWFNETMPDLNYTNPAVTKEILAATKMWLQETGVDGFRLDAIKYLIEEGSMTENTPATYAWFRKFFAVVKETQPQAFLVGEAWDTTPVVLSYTGGVMDVNFHFPFSAGLGQALGSENAGLLAGILEETVRDFPPGQYAPFIRNHDQQRLMKPFDGDHKKAKLAAAILLTLPGVPFVYYGEEIGLTRNRSAMQWVEGAPAWGFSTGKVYGNGRQETTPGLSVSFQQGQQDSLLNHYRQLMTLRNQEPVLRTGSYNRVETGNSKVLAYLRWSEGRSFLVVHNLSDLPQSQYGLRLWEEFAQPDWSVLRVWPQGSESETYVSSSDWKPLFQLEANSTYIWKIHRSSKP